MTKVILNDVGNLNDSTTAKNVINANSAIIETASDNTFSRGGGTIGSFPSGGTTGQPLVKNSNANYDVKWDTITGTGSTVKATSPSIVTPVISSITNTGTLTLPTS